MKMKVIPYFPCSVIFQLCEVSSACSLYVAAVKLVSAVCRVAAVLRSLVQEMEVV